MKKAALWGFFLLAGSALGQGVPYFSNVFTSSNNAAPGSQTQMFTEPFAKITICGATPVGNPCTNPVVIYANATMSVTAHNPITADVHGRFNFWAPAGTYSYSVQSANGTLLGTFYVTLGGSGGGSSISIQHNGSVAPNQNVLNFNDTTPAAPSGNVNVVFQNDSTGKISAYVPVGGTSFTLTTSGTTGPAAFSSGVLNIPDYTYTLTVPKISALGTLTNDTSGSAAKIGGVAISGTPSVGQVAIATSGTTASWQTISAGGAGISGQTTNCVPKANSATTLNGSVALCDDGTALAATEPVTVNDATGKAGLVAIKQGTAQATVAGAVGITAPTSVTAYNVALPPAQGTGALTNDGSGNLSWTGVLPVANGGTGTTTPGLVAGTNVTITGTWPNQTINSTGGGGGGSSTVASSETVAFSATPTFATTTNVSYIVLTGNITSFTLGAASDGQAKTLTFCQNSTGGYSVAAPTNVRGFFIVGSMPSKCSSQHFNYSTAQTAWLADSAGVINQ